MTRLFTRLAWTAATFTYLLIILGSVVRITGSGMGCGDYWPLCHGRLFPPLDDIGTLIEWNHRLVAAVVSILVAGVGRGPGGPRGGEGGGGRGGGEAARIAPPPTPPHDRPAPP